MSSGIGELPILSIAIL